MTKICTSCGASNQDASKFCGQCGAALPSGSLCSNCGTANKPTARFCVSCGTSLTSAPSPPASVATNLGTGMLAPQSILAGKYIIQQKIGQGGMGAVYKVIDTNPQPQVWAVKEMSDAAITGTMSKQQAITAFQQEARLLQQLSHSGIPKVVDYFTQTNRHFLVMEFVEGETLEQRLHQQGRACSEADVVSWGQQLCEVLNYLHSQNPQIIFRDLKPGNVMVTPRGQIKLIDFGIARFFKPGKGQDTTVIGTQGYAPPEQYGGRQTDARADIYALGVMLHQLATGYDPTRAPLLAPLPPVQQYNPQAAELGRIIVRATQQDPAQRYQSALDMRRDLLKLQPSFAPGQSVVARATQMLVRATQLLFQRATLKATLMTAGVLLAVFGVMKLLEWLGIRSNAPLMLVIGHSLWWVAPPLVYLLTHRRGAAAGVLILETLINAVFVGRLDLLYLFFTILAGATVEAIFWQGERWHWHDKWWLPVGAAGLGGLVLMVFYLFRLGDFGANFVLHAITRMTIGGAIGGGLAFLAARWWKRYGKPVV